MTCSMLLNRRYSQGLHTALMYTYAYSETQDYYHNEFDPEPSWRVNSSTGPIDWFGQLSTNSHSARQKVGAEWLCDNISRGVGS